MTKAAQPPAADKMPADMKTMWLGYCLGVAYAKGVASGALDADSYDRAQRCLEMEIERIRAMLMKDEEGT